MKFIMIQSDIDNGLRSNCLSCPVALCMTRTLSKTVSCGTTRFRIKEFYGDNNEIYYHLPPSVQQWIVQFDTWYRDKNVFSPITFEIPEPFLRV